MSQDFMFLSQKLIFSSIMYFKYFWYVFFFSSIIRHLAHISDCNYFLSKSYKFQILRSFYSFIWIDWILEEFLIQSLTITNAQKVIFNEWRKFFLGYLVLLTSLIIMIFTRIQSSLANEGRCQKLDRASELATNT